MSIPNRYTMYVRRMVLCCLGFLLASAVPGQNKREFTFKNGKLVGMQESCAYLLSPTEVYSPLAGITTTASVNANNSCPWTATSNDPWITVNSNPPGGSGNGTISFTVAAQGTYTQRSGTITVGSGTITIHQAPSCQETCLYTKTSCNSQVSTSACTESCTAYLSQVPVCQQYPSACVEVFQSCVSSCVQMAQQLCDIGYQQCMTGCN